MYGACEAPPTPLAARCCSEQWSVDVEHSDRIAVVRIRYNSRSVIHNKIVSLLNIQAYKHHKPSSMLSCLAAYYPLHSSKICCKISLT